MDLLLFERLFLQTRFYSYRTNRPIIITIFQELTAQNVTICVVGKGESFTEYNDDSVQEYLNLLDSTKKPSLRQAEAAPEDAAASADEPAAAQEEGGAMEE